MARRLLMLGPMLKARLPVLVTLLAASMAPEVAVAQSISLYSNDFEQPNEPLVGTCTAVLDQRGINLLYGGDDFSFQQTFTVEGFLIDTEAGYSDPENRAGNYAIGMLSASQPDLLALVFDARDFGFVNVSFMIAGTDIAGCGGLFGLDVPQMTVSVHDAPGGVFSITNRGPALSEGMVTGVATEDYQVLRWASVTVPLDISASRDGNIALVFDLTASGYGLIDNLAVVAAPRDDIFDEDVDAIPDDLDNCPGTQNPLQEDGDQDLVGDPCDPDPTDPLICGDSDEDGTDDCALSVAPEPNDDCACTGVHRGGRGGALGLWLFGLLGLLLQSNRGRPSAGPR